MNRPSDLVRQVVLGLVAFVIGCALYGFAGEQFSKWVVEKKLPEIQAQMKDQFANQPFKPAYEFEQIDVGTLNGGGMFAGDALPGKGEDSPASGNE